MVAGQFWTIWSSYEMVDVLVIFCSGGRFLIGWTGGVLIFLIGQFCIGWYYNVPQKYATVESDSVLHLFSSIIGILWPLVHLFVSSWSKPDMDWIHVNCWWTAWIVCWSEFHVSFWTGLVGCKDAQQITSANAQKELTKTDWKQNQIFKSFFMSKQ